MDNKKSILITGTSSGIGKACALYLAEKGFNVYAGVRKQADADSLKKESSGALTPIILDVTDENTIHEAVDRIAGETGGHLWGLVNNAGLSINAPLELTPVSDIRKLMDVNVCGLLAVTKAFIPLLRKRAGRIVNISSGHGLLAIPDKSVYAASKFAVQAVTDSLRVELRPFGMNVSSIVVGKINTDVLGKIIAERQKMVDAAPPEIAKLYEPLIKFFDKEVKTIPGIDAVEAAKVVGKALTAPKPLPQYLIGPGAKKMKKLAGLPVWLRDWLMYTTIYKPRK